MAGKSLDGVSSVRPQSFRYQCRPPVVGVGDCNSPGPGGTSPDDGTRDRRFFLGKMADHCTAEKVRAGLRHTVVRPNVTGRAKDEKITQSKRARAGSLAIVD